MGPSWCGIWDGDLPSSKISRNLLAELLCFQKSDEGAGMYTIWTTSLGQLLTWTSSLSLTSPGYDSQKNRRNTGSMTEKGFSLDSVLDSTSSFEFLSSVSSSTELLKHQRRIWSPKSPTRRQSSQRVKALQRASKSGGISTNSCLCRCSTLIRKALPMRLLLRRVLGPKENQQEYQPSHHHRTPKWDRDSWRR